MLADHPRQIGLSPYHFTGNNPVLYNDPNGECHDCPDGSQVIAEDQVLSFFVLNAIAAVRNISSTIAGFIGSGQGNSYIVRTQHSVVADGDGQVSIHESQPYLQDKASAALFGLIDGVSLYPGSGPTLGLMGKSGAGPTVGSNAKELLKANKEAGKVGEDFLNNAFGGTPQVSIGVGKERRVIDNLTESGVAQESKVGRTSLTKTVRTQISKDVGNISNPLIPQVRSAEWHFFPGKGLGPSKPLQNELNRVRIPFVVHD